MAAWWQHVAVEGERGGLGMMFSEVSVGITVPSNPMVAAACNGDIHVMQSMVTKHGPDILSTRGTIGGCTFLKESKEIILAPFVTSWTIHCDARPPLPGTPALAAARNGRTDALQFLVTHTVRCHITNGLTELLTATTASGGTAAHLAARGGWTDVLSFLVDQLGVAVLTVRDNDGWLPAHSAARGGHIEALRWIASHTSTEAVLDEQGSGATLESVARKYGQREVRELIQEFYGQGQVPVQIRAAPSSKPTSVALSRPTSVALSRPSRARSQSEGACKGDFLSRLAEAEYRDSALPLNPQSRPLELMDGLHHGPRDDPRLQQPMGQGDAERVPRNRRRREVGLRQRDDTGQEGKGDAGTTRAAPTGSPN